MKKLCSVILGLCLVLCVFCLSAAPARAETDESGTCGDNLTWTLDDEGLLTISGTGAMEDYTASAAGPFYSRRSSIKTVVIESGVTTIGNYAFYECSGLTGVTIPGSVTSIGERAFQACSGLAGAAIPEGVTRIGDSAFFKCTSLANVTIPESVTRIDDGAFQNCSSLTSVAIPEGVTRIGDYTFFKCGQLADVTIPDSVTVIGYCAFSDCSRLTDVYYGGTKAQWFGINIGSNNSYAVNAKWHCSDGILIAAGTCGDHLSWTLDDTGRLTISGTGAMANYRIDDWEMPASPFYPHRSKIKTAVIENGVTSIGEYAFYYCSSLTSVTIPEGVTSIGEYAFYHCSSLTGVTIPEGVTSIGNYTFSGCSSLTGITIPDSVTSIGNYAFSNCSSLTGVTIPASVTSIGNYAFYYCSSLTGITIPDSVTSIGNYAFYYCSSLTSVTIPEGVTRIGGHAFHYCSSLTSITIPESVTSIGDYAFYYCSSLTSVTIPSRVTSIGQRAFCSCSSLTSVTIPPSVTSIGDYAFYGCSSLTYVLYDGTQAQWDAISIGSYNNSLTGTVWCLKSPPQAITASNNDTTGRIVLSWRAAPGITCNVYRAASENGTYEKLNTSPVAGPTYTDGRSGNAGTTYWYKVTTVADDFESDLSAPVSRVAKCQRPTNLKATANADGSVRLSWDAPLVKGSVSAYRVYLRVGDSGAFQWIDGSLKAGGTATAVNVTAASLDRYRGQSVQFSLRGFHTKNTTGSLSDYAAPASATVVGMPYVPTGLSAVNNQTTGRVKLRWNGALGAAGYNIYRSKTENGTYEKLNASPIAELTYTDGRSGNAGNIYWYKITAVNDFGESDMTAAVSRISKCQRPAGLKAKSNADGSVTLTWDAPQVKGSVSGYRVYLWDTAKGAFQWIGGSLKAAGTATSVTIPAGSLRDYQGQIVKFSLRGFNTKDTLGTISIYAAPASATVK